MDEPARSPWWRTPSGIVLCSFLAVAGFLLLTEPTAHFFGVLPYLLLAACQLMHVFMHHGRHQHGDDRENRDDKDSTPTGGSR